MLLLCRESWIFITVILVCCIFVSNHRYVLWPPIYLDLIFEIFQFKISSLMNLIINLFRTLILQATACRKIKFKLFRKNILFIKLDISNWRIAKHVQIDRRYGKLLWRNLTKDLVVKFQIQFSYRATI